VFVISLSGSDGGGGGGNGGGGGGSSSCFSLRYANIIL